jgi:DNA-binding beta-propeller fold protein YncE
MFARLPLFVAAAGASFAPSVGAAGADLAFAHNFLAGSRQIVSFPAGNPSVMAVVGPQMDLFTGMAFSPDASVLWAINITSQTLGTLSQATGAFTPVTPLQAPCCISAFTIDPVHGTFYVSKSDHLVYELNPTTGATVLLALGAFANAQITALAMDCGGRLFAADGLDQGSIYRVRFDANPTLVGTTGISRPTSLSFDNSNGVLYGWFNPGGVDGISTHGVVDTSTAQVSATSVISGRYRMAMRNACSLDQLQILVDGFEG